MAKRITSLGTSCQYCGKTLPTRSLPVARNLVSQKYIVNCPSLLYWATKDKGAFFNKKQIQVHNKDPIYKIIGINTSGASTELLKRLEPIYENYEHTRHFGANALEMALFARGLMDIFIDLRDKIRIQDIAAGYIIVKEAGGLLLDANLNPLDSDLSYSTRVSFIAAANQKILDEIMSQMNQ